MKAPASAAIGTATSRPEPRPDAEMHVERRRRIGAKADIERMTERQLAGKAHHDVPGLAGIGEIQNQDQHGEQIVAGEERRGEKHKQAARQAATSVRRGTPSVRRAIMPPSCP